MSKKVRNLYLRKGDHPFILKTLFAYRAKQQKQSDEELNKVIRKTLYKDKMHVYAILMDYVESKENIQNAKNI